MPAAATRKNQSKEKRRATILRLTQLLVGSGGVSQFLIARRADIHRTSVSLYLNGHIDLDDAALCRLEKVVEELRMQRVRELQETDRASASCTPAPATDEGPRKKRAPRRTSRPIRKLVLDAGPMPAADVPTLEETA